MQQSLIFLLTNELFIPILLILLGASRNFTITMKTNLLFINIITSRLLNYSSEQAHTIKHIFLEQIR